MSAPRAALLVGITAASLLGVAVLGAVVAVTGAGFGCVAGASQGIGLSTTSGARSAIAEIPHGPSASLPGRQLALRHRLGVPGLDRRAGVPPRHHARATTARAAPARCRSPSAGTRPVAPATVRRFGSATESTPTTTDNNIPTTPQTPSSPPRASCGKAKHAPPAGGSYGDYRRAACGYYGACGDATADYADEVMTRAVAYGFGDDQPDPAVALRPGAAARRLKPEPAPASGRSSANAARAALCRSRHRSPGARRSNATAASDRTSYSSPAASVSASPPALPSVTRATVSTRSAPPSTLSRDPGRVVAEHRTAGARGRVEALLRRVRRRARVRPSAVSLRRLRRLPRPRRPDPLPLRRQRAPSPSWLTSASAASRRTPRAPRYFAPAWVDAFTTNGRTSMTIGTVGSRPVGSRYGAHCSARYGARSSARYGARCLGVIRTAALAAQGVATGARRRQLPPVTRGSAMNPRSPEDPRRLFAVVLAAGVCVVGSHLSVWSQALFLPSVPRLLLVVLAVGLVVAVVGRRVACRRALRRRVSYVLVPTDGSRQTLKRCSASRPAWRAPGAR